MLVASGAVALVVIAVLSRVLLLTSLSPEIAAARGVPVRAVGAAYLATLAVAVSLSAVAIGAVLSTALLIGPAATALRLARSPGRAMLASAAVGTIATWIGILLAYDSYAWPPDRHGWPVSFFVVVLVLIAYLLSHSRRPRTRRPRTRRPGAREEVATTQEETLLASLLTSSHSVRIFNACEISESLIRNIRPRP